MNLVKDVKDKYIKDIRKELEDRLDGIKDIEKRNSEDSSHTDYIYRTGVIAGLELAIELIKEYE